MVGKILLFHAHHAFLLDAAGDDVRMANLVDCTDVAEEVGDGDDLEVGYVLDEHAANDGAVVDHG